MTFTTLLVFFLVWVGHSAIWLVCLNVVYSQPIDKRILGLVRLAVAILVFGFPLFVWFAVPRDFGPVESIAPFVKFLGLGMYFALCLVMSCWIIPLVTLRRQFRAVPVQLVSTR